MTQPPNKRFRLPEVSDNWQEYFLSILFQIITPLIPLAIEFWLTSDISEQSLTITAAIYTITTGVSSKQKWQFGLAIISSLIFSMVFGVVTAIEEFEIVLTQTNALSNSGFFATLGILAISILHVLERFNRHVVNTEKYWDFK